MKNSDNSVQNGDNSVQNGDNSVQGRTLWFREGLFGAGKDSLVQGGITGCAGRHNWVCREVYPG